jgi:hypothetical protein
MKINLFCVSTVAALCIGKAFAGGTNDIEWGMNTNGLQMSISAAGGTATIKTNQPFTLVVRIKSVSTGPIAFGYEVPLETTESLSWLVVAPSGKDISPIRQPTIRGSSVHLQIDPNEIFQFEYSLSSICSFDEIGTYKIVATKNVGTKPHEPRLVESNPLYLTVIPGEWKSEVTNAPPTRF